MGFLSDLFLGKQTEPSVQQFETLNPQQKSLMKALGPYLRGQIGKGVQPYTGQVVAGMTPEETATLQRMRGAVGGQTPLAPELTSAYQTLLSGKPAFEIDPQRTEDLYQSIAGPAYREFKERTMPLINEAYAGPGFWSESRSRAIGREAGNLQEAMLGKRAELYYADELARRGELSAARNRMMQAAPGAAGFGRYQREIPFLEQQRLMQQEALPRMLDQAQLDWNYRDFLRTRPEANPALEYAMQILGIPMIGYMGFEGTQQPGILGSLIGAGANMWSGNQLAKALSGGTPTTSAGGGGVDFGGGGGGSFGDNMYGDWWNAGGTP